MGTGLVAVTTLNKARRKKRRYGAVVTIEDPGQRNPLRFHKSPHPDHLVLKFEDVDIRDEAIALPKEQHVRAVLEFGRRHTDDDILVHCKAGIARSTALALTIIADRLGPGQEAAAVARLLEVRPEAAPNLLILGMADDLMEREGALVEAWMAVENSDPEYAQHRRDKLEILEKRPELFARAKGDASATIQLFTETSITPRFVSYP
jgi:predicted protein tyrosine phosphatase